MITHSPALDPLALSVGLQAVIFLASHDENGSAGFILNRPTSVCLGDLLEDGALPHFRGTPLYLGGDVGK